MASKAMPGMPDNADFP